MLIVSLSFLASVATGCGGDGARSFGGDTGGDQGASGGRSGEGDGGIAGAPGTGGRTGSGGIQGSGGVTGGGGLPGFGGHPTTGGTTGSGGSSGNKGTGGIAGSGGRIGTGGSGGLTGSGGRAAMGGTGGVGNSGSGGASPVTCDDIAKSYGLEMVNARTCTLGTPYPQCQMKVSSALGCASNCAAYVQNATVLTEIAKRWSVANCDSLIRACPAIACLAATPGNCALTAMATTAQCQQGSLFMGP
jgi:hypothetical protein